MRRVAVLSFGVLLACSVQLPESDAGSESESSTASESSEGPQETTGTETESAGCQPLECAMLCGDMYNECGTNFLLGLCVEDECVCEDPADNCLPCGVEVPCLEWQICEQEYSVDGKCSNLCHYEFELAWDAEVGCTFQLNPELPYSRVVDFYWYLKIEGIEQPRGMDCAMPEAWTLDLQQKTLTLCPGACGVFESAGVMQTGWGLPCS